MEEFVNRERHISSLFTSHETEHLQVLPPPKKKPSITTTFID